MAQSILQTFLNEHVITIGDNDEFTLLTKAATEFEKRLRGKKSRVSQAAQVAFDPAVKPTELLITEVQELITSKWKAFPSKCQDKPVPYVRAVILTTLQKLAEEVPFAGIVWLTVSNYFPFAEGIPQREAAVLREFLEEAGNTYQQAGIKAWELDGSYQEPKILGNEKMPVTPANTVNQEYATKHMLSAVQGTANGTNENVFAKFTYRDGYSGSSPTVSIKAEDAWATSFSTIAGGTLTAIANQIITDVNKSLSEAASINYVTKYTDSITRYLREVGEAMSRQTASHNLRSQLLWVKESMYSTGQNTSYRTLPLAVLPLVLASDAADIVPAVYPSSVEFFLRETLAAANADTDATCTFEELLAELLVERATILASLPPVSPEAGRSSLLAFIRHLAAGTTQPADLAQFTGLRLTDTINRQKFGVWIFRELQVLKLVATK